MYWKKIFGEKLFKQVKKYAMDKNLSISSLVRIAISQYIETK